MIVKQKQHIKHLFAAKYSKNLGYIDLAILTDDNRYLEYSIEFRSKVMTTSVMLRIRNLFEPYFIDKNSDIMVNRLLDKDQPLYQYLMILRQHIGFRLSSIDLDKIVNRIHYFYTRETATKSRCNKVWYRIIESKQCPWITREVDYAIQNKGPTMASRIKMVRLAMFYIVVKNHLYRIKTKSMKKALTKEMPIDV